jgi:hypothetical protein
MLHNCATPAFPAQASALVAHSLSRHLTAFLAPLWRTLDQQLDRRLVSTFLATLIAIVQWRNRAHGLLLSELGAYLLTPEQAPADTKRLSNLLRSPRWSAKLLADTLWQQADGRLQSLRASGEEPLLVWDGSVLEKPETLKNDDLCAVRSSKARRLKRIRPGFFNPPAVAQSACLVCTGWACSCSGARARLPWRRCSGGRSAASVPVTSKPSCGNYSPAVSKRGGVTFAISGIASSPAAAGCV